MKKIFLITLLFSACGIHRIPYFDTIPTVVSNTQNQVEALTLVLENDIKDTVTINGAGLKPMKVMELRKSLSNAMVKTLRTSFNSVKVGDHKPSGGISIVLVEFVPYWHSELVLRTEVGHHDKVKSSSNSEAACVIRYEVVFYGDGQEIKRLNRETMSSVAAVTTKNMENTFKSGVKIMSEEIYREAAKIFAPQ